MDGAKKISTNNFQIEKNLISFSDSVIQISNISQVDVASPPKKQLNTSAIAAIVLGVFISMVIPELEMIGVIVAICGVGYIGLYIYLNSNESTYLNISLNSGRVYSIICKDKEFLKEVMQVIKYCINNHSTKTFQIDFENCNITNSPIIQGDDNEVNLCP